MHLGHSVIPYASAAEVQIEGPILKPMYLLFSLITTRYPSVNGSGNVQIVLL